MARQPYAEVVKRISESKCIGERSVAKRTGWPKIRLLPGRPLCGAKERYSPLGWERGVEQCYRKKGNEESSAFPGLERALLLVRGAIGRGWNVYSSLAVSSSGVDYPMLLVCFLKTPQQPTVSCLFHEYSKPGRTFFQINERRIEIFREAAFCIIDKTVQS